MICRRRCVQVFRKDVYPPRWPGGKMGQQFAPPDTPPCGFRGELCTEGQGQRTGRSYAIDTTFQSAGSRPPRANAGP